MSLVLNNWAQAFAFHSYILLYPVILLVDSEGLDQTLWLCMLEDVFTWRGPRAQLLTFLI